MYDARSGWRQTIGGKHATSVAGALAAAAAFAANELFSGLAYGGPSLLVAVAAKVIDFSPKVAKDLAIAVFGTNDKLALAVMILVVGIGFGVGLGAASSYRFWMGQLGFGLFAILGAAAGVAYPLVPPMFAVLGAAVAGISGISVLAYLLSLAPDSLPRLERDARLGQRGRRSFLRVAGVLAVVVGAAAVGGRILVQRAQCVVATRAMVVLPLPSRPAVPILPGASIDVEGLAPIVTPNDDFYRIDTALVVPKVDLSTYTLKVEGLVSKPFELSYDELLAISTVQRHVTLCCVSNEVGGPLVGNAMWQGVPLRDLLDRAGVRPDASQVVGLSVDGFTAGFPVSAAYDGREALVAVGMNNEPLPLDHGFPARLVVAGLYGYVSATKWLDSIVLNRLEDFDGYWIPRGWAKEAPIKTQARIDVPRRGRVLLEGRQVVAGVAWAPHRGVTKVEVQIDDGDWQEALLGEAISKNTWRQWTLPWNTTPGSHVLRVRATDATGVPQTSEKRRPDPDGATGYHTLSVQVVAKDR